MFTHTTLISAPAEHGADTAYQLVRVKGFGQIVIRPGVKACNAVIRLPFRSEHHNRNLNSLLAEPL